MRLGDMSWVQAQGELLRIEQMLGDRIRELEAVRALGFRINKERDS